MSAHLGCETIRLLVQADHDGELDPAQAAAAAAHVASCAGCARWQAELAELSAALHAAIPALSAPPALAERWRREARAVAPRRRWLTREAGGGVLVGLAVAACAVLLVLPRVPTGDDAEASVAAHIRALQPGHLFDVPSTDQHTVKPWFDGRLDYAPPVRDFAAQGFPLVGGRLDYLDGRPVAALVYRRAQHVIDLFVWPEAQALPSTAREQTRNGYTVLTWRRDGMRFRAVSDVEPAELGRFAALWGG